MEPNLRRAVELFSQGIKQGSLLTRSGNAQNFSGSRKPFIGSDPVPVNQGRTPIPPSFRPNPVSPGQLGLFDIRATPSSSFNPSLERTGPRLSVPGSRPLSTLPANYFSFPEAPAGEIGSFRVMPESTRTPVATPSSSSFNPSLERTGPRLSVPGSRPLSTLPANYFSFPEAPAGEIGSFRVMPESTRTPVGVAGSQRSLIGSERFRAPSLPPALTGGGSSPSIMDLIRTAAVVRGGGAAGLAALAERSTPEPNYRNLGYASEADMKGRIGAQELLQSGRYLPGSQQQSIPNQTPLPRNNPLANNVPDRDPLPQYTPPGNNRPDRVSLPQATGNTMTPAAAFTRFFVDDANRLSPTAMELATATGGVQTRDLGSLTSGLKAADLESALNSVASAQAMSDSPSFMAGNPLMGTPKLMLSGAREQAVNEQKQQYAKQGAPKGITNEQRDYVLTMQAQQAAGKVLLPEILKNLGYSPQDPATRDLAVWAESNPGLALAVYNKQLEQNLNNRSDFPSPRELSSSDPVNQQSASNVEGTMVNSPMGANLARNAVANSHFNANAYVSGSQEATELADATQPLVQPTLQTAEQFIDQAPERAEATAQISDEMLKRAMELKLGKMSMDPSLLGN